MKQKNVHFRTIAVRKTKATFLSLIEDFKTAGRNLQTATERLFVFGVLLVGEIEFFERLLQSRQTGHLLLERHRAQIINRKTMATDFVQGDPAVDCDIGEHPLDARLNAVLRLIDRIRFEHRVDFLFVYAVHASGVVVVVLDQPETLRTATATHALARFRVQETADRGRRRPGNHRIHLADDHSVAKHSTRTETETFTCLPLLTQYTHFWVDFHFFFI